MTVTETRPTGFEPLDPAIREQYQRDGYYVIKGALDEESRAKYEDAVDQVYAEEEAADRLRPDKSIHVMGYCLVVLVVSGVVISLGLTFL